MEQMWWKQVPNAAAFVSNIVETLVDEKSVIVHSAADIPWRDAFMETILDAVRQKNSSKSFEQIEPAPDPGKYLLKEFCRAEKRAAYRPSKSSAVFLAQNDDIVLHERYLWVTLPAHEDFDRWSTFVSEYMSTRPESKPRAVFILEYRSDEHIPKKRGIRIFDYEESIGEYDKLVFCTLAASSVQERSFLKNYLAELAMDMTDGDMELCAACIGHYRDFLRDPVSVLRDIAAELIRSDGMPCTLRKTSEELMHNVWLAQLRTMYPKLEAYRGQFIRRHRNEISALLPLETKYGVLRDPDEVELGILKWLADDHKLRLTQNEAEQLGRYRDARNSLSHLNALSFSDLQNLYGCHDI